MLSDEVADEDFFRSSVELYERGSLDTAKSIPVYFFQYGSHEQGGNSFGELADQITGTSFVEALPDEVGYQIAMIDQDGKDAGVVTGYPSDENEGEIIAHPWKGTDIDQFTLKLSAPLLRALSETSLDLSNVKASLISFSGIYGAVFYDEADAYFTPVMGEGGISSGELYVDQSYPIIEAVEDLETSFTS